MLYSREFYPKNHPSIVNKVKIESDTVFSVILKNKVENDRGYGLYSIINSVKPLAYFSSIFGHQIVRYKNNDIHDFKLRNKMYSLCVIAALFLSHVLVRPKSWKDTKSDIPLNVLTISFGLLVIVKVSFLIFISTFTNGELYSKLLKKFDDFDQHFMTSRMLFIKRKVFVIFVITWTLIQISLIFWLQPFHLHNLGPYFVLYSIILQGAIILFVLENIYSRQLVFNELLMNKISDILPENKNIINKKSFRDGVIMKILFDPRILEQKICCHYSWFELMQMYDKTADCVYLFNKIYAGQVFFMFLSALLNTMLSICRYLSPTLKNSDIALSDLYVYTCINACPLYVAQMCELLIKQKDKTLLMLLNILVYGELDDKYYSQIQTMTNLVDTRKMELSASVFTANLQTVLEFFGRVISYTVLMIQYFYMHVFST